MMWMGMPVGSSHIGLDFLADLAGTNLPSAGWRNLGTVITATNTSATASDLIGGDPRRFYRIGMLR
jgi:hypothetical protein